jgi:anti-sigma B factor antagonist
VQEIQIETSTEGERHVLRVAGDIDLASGRALTSAMQGPLGAGSGALILDLTQVTFLDSTGLAAVLHGVRRMSRQNRRTLIVCPPGQPAELLHHTKVRDVLELVGSRDEAEARLREPEVA